MRDSTAAMGIFSKGEIDKKDLPYPAKHRSFLRCSLDPICLGLFGATVAFWLALSFDAFASNHSPMMLLTGQDYTGTFCGTGDFKGYDYLYYTVNPHSPCLWWQAYPFVPTESVYNATVDENYLPNMTEMKTILLSIKKILKIYKNKVKKIKKLI